ncbi:MAG TPA: DUF202 domain-containing protein, partial [Actinotalea sp.]|nr:DUF202 domain-containing protein [Actinotalea sp.]
PRSVYGVGADPDPRFSLANERTALAWVRTGLALVAGGIALTSLVALAGLGPGLDLVAAALCLFGGFVALGALRGWRATERAMRLGEGLPAPRLLPTVVVAVVVLAAVLGGYALGRVW